MLVDGARTTEIGRALEIDVVADIREGARRPPAGGDGKRKHDGLTIGRYLPIVPLMRRKAGALVPLEVAILEAALKLRQRGSREAHGFLLAKELRDGRNARRLTAYGTLYKALDRLERAGYLASRWEDPQVAADEGRPRGAASIG